MTSTGLLLERSSEITAGLRLPLAPDGEPEPAAIEPLVEAIEQHEVFEALFGRSREHPRLGRYAVLGILGKGGMGTVLEAFDRTLDRRVALKVLHRGMGDHYQARLLREAQALAKLSHPNVVQVYEAGEADGRTFIAMELVEGRSLQRWMGEEPRPSWRECIQVFLCAGEGLAAAHAEGLVHRDFKPSNVLIDGKGQVKVLDFGLARRAEDLASAQTRPSEDIAASALDTPLTQSGAVLGTPAYMALEQLRGEEADARSDQFGFCVSLYEVLYCERPFDGGSVASLMRSLGRGQVRPAPRGSTVPDAVRRVILRGLATNPDDRWSSMDELLVRLRRQVVPRRNRWLAVALALGMLSVGVQQGLRLMDERAVAERRARASEAELKAQQRRAADEAKRQEASALAESARFELEEQRPMRALAYLVGALDLDPGSGDVRTLTSRALEGPLAHLGDGDGEAPAGDPKPQEDLDFIPDEGRRVLSPDGAHVMTISRSRFGQASVPPGKLWTTRGEQEIPLRPELHEHVSTAAFAPDARTLAIAYGDHGGLQLRDPASGELSRELVGHRAEITAIGFSHGGELLATAGKDGTAVIWDVGSGQRLQILPMRRITPTFGHVGIVIPRAVVFSQDDTQLLVDEGDLISRWRVGAVGCLERRSTAIEYEPVSSGDAAAYAAMRRVHTITGGDFVALIETIEDPPEADGASRGMHDAMVIQGLPAHEERARLESPMLYIDSTLSPSGTYFAGAEMFGRVTVWDHASGREPIHLVGHGGPVGVLTFSPDDRFLASVGLVDGSVRLWDHGAGIQLAMIETNVDAVQHLAFSPDGRLLAAVRASGTVTLWQVEGMRYHATIAPRMGELRGLRFELDSNAISLWTKDGTRSTCSIEQEPLDLAMVRELYERFSPWQLRRGKLVGR